MICSVTFDTKITAYLILLSIVEDDKELIIISLSGACVVPVGVYYHSHVPPFLSVMWALINARLMNVALSSALILRQW